MSILCQTGLALLNATGYELGFYFVANKDRLVELPIVTEMENMHSIQSILQRLE